MLKLSFNNLGDEGLKEWAAAIMPSRQHDSAAPALTRLELAANGITDAGIDALKKILVRAGSSLEYLELSGNKLGDAGVRALSDVLAAPDVVPALTLVGLHANGIGDEGAAFLAANVLPKSVIAYLGQ